MIYVFVRQQDCVNFIQSETKGGQAAGEETYADATIDEQRRLPAAY
jgi:hypothetical protein